MRAAFSLALTVALAAVGRSADKPIVIDLWPGPVPGVTAASGDEKLTGKQGSRQLTNVTKPTITVYRAPTPKAPDGKEPAPGPAVLIAPGGGYNILAWDHEGEDVAARLNSLGVTAVLLKYRVPAGKGEDRNDPGFGPLRDAQRAMSLIRGKAKEWNVDPKRVGMLGFSAGGHLTALTATNFDKRGYESVDEADKQSCRPDFAVLVYPGGVVGPDGQLAPGVRVSKETPPCFFAQAGDDPVSAENSVQMYLALKKAKVPAELHVYAVGGHGFGMRQLKNPANTWPKRCEEWMRSQKVLPNGSDW
jgi:acetyl esterase/lipase